MGNGWSPERQAKQRAAIYRWRPWEQSSGPKTDAGKRRVAQNALKHGGRSQAHLEEMRAVRRWLDELQ